MQFVLYSHRVFYKILLLIVVMFLPLMLSFLEILKFDAMFLLYYSCIVIVLLPFAIWRSFVVKLQLIANQIANIIAKKPYQKLPDLGLDEYGLICFFVNDLVYNFENVASYIKSGQRMYTELTMAQHIQENLLPSNTLKLKNYQFLVKHRSADELGGDMFNFRPTKSGFDLYLADATGHGAPAALIMIMVQTMFLTNQSLVLDKLIVLLNSFLKSNTSASMFLSSVFMNLNDQGKVLYYPCGYEKIHIFRQSEAVVESFDTKGVALGLLEDISKKLEQKSLQLVDGDVMVLASDGVTELKDQNGKLFGPTGLVDLISKYSHLPTVNEVYEKIKLDLDIYANGSLQLDDITLCIIKYTGVADPNQKEFSTSF